ncbi:hypothetical protein BDN72DRAFT_845606 [Pluteus cervinus]|uniref:Uncharacterized protein n=1 Tax=Pluteus cervinus TaxID=181527 RepID=A0ACD3AHS7_9AGAR|nr:hypothetical protein BDN72DRAFT_845606 [Pluteus cervinus]
MNQPHPIQHRAAILELPTELIEFIIRSGRLSQKDVLQLAVTCKVLHGVLLPILLSQVGIEAESASLHLCQYKSNATASSLQNFRNPNAIQGTPSPDSLSLVKLAFWIKSIPKLKCTIHGGGFPAIIEQINRLEEMMGRFASLDEVEIVFGQADPGVVGWSATVDKDIMVWVNSFCALLRRVVEKEAKRFAVREGMVMCRVDYIPLPGDTSRPALRDVGSKTSLRVVELSRKATNSTGNLKEVKKKKYRLWKMIVAPLRAYFSLKFGRSKHEPIALDATGGGSSTSPAPTSAPPETPRPRKSNRDIRQLPYLGLRRELGQFHERRHPNLISLVPKYCGRIPRTQLETLEIASEILVTPPFSHWTLDLIKASPHLTTLILSNLALTVDSSQAWLSRLVDSLSASGCILTSLSLLGCWSIRFEDLLRFIGRFEDLEELVMDKSCDPVDRTAFKTSSRSYYPVLRKLKKVQTTPGFLGYLLRLETLDPKRSSRDANRLSDVAQEDPFPDLEELRIWFIVSPGLPLDGDDANLHRILSYATKSTRPKPCHTIGFIFDDRIGWFPSFQIQDDSKDGLKKFECVTDLVIPFQYMGYEILTRTGRSSGSPGSFLREPPLVAFYARRLESRSEGLRDKTFGFFNSFEGVRRVKVVETPIMNGGRVEVKMPTQKEIRILVDDVKAKCQRVERVEIRDVVYETAG